MGWGRHVRTQITLISHLVQCKELIDFYSGGGIRTIMLFTPLFERLVNGIQEYSPETKLVFNTTPEDTLESVRRQFPDV